MSTIKLSKQQWQFIGKKAGWIKTAGDEWSDEKTHAFAEQLSQIMNQDDDVRVSSVENNKIYFEHFHKSQRVPLVLEIMEFGYGDQSESLNGRIYSEEVAAFRIPGGTTRTRSPEEFWKSAKNNLEDIMKRAGV